MASLTDYSEQKFNDWRTGTANMPATTTRYLAAFTTATTDAGGGTEVTGNAYARVAITPDMAAAAGAGGSVLNTGDVLFPVASGGSWGTITHVATFDAATVGNMIEHAALTASKIINDTDQLIIPIGSLGFTAD